MWGCVILNWVFALLRNVNFEVYALGVIACNWLVYIRIVIVHLDQLNINKGSYKFIIRHEKYSILSIFKPDPIFLALVNLVPWVIISIAPLTLPLLIPPRVSQLDYSVFSIYSPNRKESISMPSYYSTFSNRFTLSVRCSNHRIVEPGGLFQISPIFLYLLIWFKFQSHRISTCHRLQRLKRRSSIYFRKTSIKFSICFFKKDNPKLILTCLCKSWSVVITILWNMKPWNVFV